MTKALYEKQLEGMNEIYWQELKTRVVATIKLCLDDDIIYHFMDEESPVEVWKKLESQHMSTSLLTNFILGINCLVLRCRKAQI
ncbi:Retrovirus-related Pol polyprotein from transposon TNT 1-94 [Populus alba x Populus x berolinensis]|uniref:Retrovirus-related Pol polyprotein from transposon TNT 1-94 n=1 Tax=Populus alba x Populus x berolinensis TaxID=444605 RepID=A0AAD6W3I9_9ROSI|nr:Retrovirus-related Pol polyprotein from transposon TNT 1-94 [Populus alba x Populus x berolinensis]